MTTLPELIRAVRPEAVAVRQHDAVLTYGELVAGAEALAGRLHALGLGPEDVVGVCLARLPSLVTGLLGVLFSGAAYLPLDPSLPTTRLATLLRGSGARALVTDGAALSADLPVVRLGAGPGRRVEAHPDSAAYVMYTSGSTGVPKGVVVSHRSLAHFVTDFVDSFGIGPDDVAIGFASVGFDVSLVDLFVPLVAGGSVALVGVADRADPVRLQRFLETHGVTFGDVPPAILPLLDPARLPTLRLLFTGSEAPGPEQVARWATGHRRFVNCYGPTECTVQVTAYEASGRWREPLPIGTPVGGHRVVLDERGELLAGGPGLARGYLGDPGLTADRFVPDPDAVGGRLYRTGDLAAWRPDGNLAFLGRADRQVKIRGQRIEVGEVEAVLRAYPEVGHAVVVPRDGVLYAFVTGSTVDTVELGRHAAERLPAAAVPSRITVVDEFPLGPTGKVDVARLPVQPDARTVEAPATPTEQAVARVWAGVLGRSGVGRSDDFFDAGGHSISAMRLVAALRTALGQDVAIEDVLSGRTLAGISARVDAARPLAARPAQRGRPPALSPAQRRLWFLDRYAPEAAAAYNIGFGVRLRGPLDVHALRRALREVATRQEVLRWRIVEADGVPRAVVDPPADVPLSIVDTTKAELVARLDADARRRFDLATGPLWRVQLRRLGDDDHVLGVTAHHAVFDGWSEDLFYADLSAAYAGLPLPPLPATYGDYVAYRDDRRAQRADADLAWWVEHLTGAPTILELPADRPRPAEQTFGGALVSSTVDAGPLNTLARSLGATPSAVLLAALGIVASRVTGLADLVVGTPTVDRRDPDFEPMVGFFIEIAPLRLRVEAEDTFGTQVRRARDELLAALAHPEAPMERIVDAFDLGGQVVRNPLVQVLFNMFNFTAPELTLPGLTSEPVPVAVPGSPFDLTVYGVERDGRLLVEFVYNPDLFDEARMRTLLDGLTRVLAQGVAAPEVLVRDLDLAGLTAPASPAAPPLAQPRPAPTGAPMVLEPPATATEEAVAAVWREVLGLAEVGVTDNFFRVGGSSLAIVAVQRRLNRVLDEQLRVVDLFRYPTIRALAGHLDGSEGDVVERAARRGAARRGRVRRGRGA